MCTVEQKQLMRQLEPIELTTLGEYKFVEGYIGKGSYGLVRLAYPTKPSSNDSSSEQTSSDSSSSSSSSSYEDTPKSFEYTLESPKNYHQQHQHQQDLVAVKLFDKRKIMEKKVENSLINEVAILKELDGHNNIIKFKEEIQNQTAYGIVTEYASGGDLLDFIKSQHRLSECQAKPMFRQIVSAVCYAHKKLIVHRDLKAENVFLTNDFTVKIGDWGLAAKYDPNHTINKVCGSIHYASPEIIQGQNYVGPEIDVWSLGVLLYAMTTGTLPFFGNDKDIKHKICRAKYQCPAFLSNGLVQLIEWMLQPNPILRCRLKDVIHHPWLRPLHPIPRFTSYHHKALYQQDDDEDDDDDLTSSSSSSFSSDEDENLKCLPKLPVKPLTVPITIPVKNEVISKGLRFSAAAVAAPPVNGSVSTLFSPKSSGAMSPKYNSPSSVSPPLLSPKVGDPKKRKKFSIDVLVGKVKGLVCDLVSGATAPKASSVHVSPM